ncbi:hypothetical protein JP75_18585 [Devosia riboflavina]|uniref:Mercury transport protein n=1 Tax=Devosia riboflavina TaxID=46914 RepID=A0A087LYV8_9HYPH|nr:hypothetical protein JP75_18585 [Devosia riboflavina]
MNSAAKKGIVATAGLTAACAACCAVPIVAGAGMVTTAAPMGIAAIMLTGIASAWAWFRRRSRQ